jgi:peptidoglycan/LPS O-acetylase OafA/YrhL
MGPITASAPGRISQFDGVRALAFLAVFLHHAFGAPLLWMGVDLFFVLSGFLITRNLLGLRETSTVSSALATFFFRRVLRIVPPYYAALGLIMVLTPALANDMAWHLTFLTNIHDGLFFVPPGPLNNMWSIAVEEQFYLVWPWIVLLVPRDSLRRVFATVIGAAFVARGLLHIQPEAVYRLTICRMDLLAGGAVLALIERRDASWFGKWSWAFRIAMSVSAVLFAVASVISREFTHHSAGLWFALFGYALSTMFFTMMLAYVRGLRDELSARVLRLPALQYVGKISYMAYLTHRLALEVARNALPHSGRIAVAIVAMTATIAVSSLSWYLLEQPLQGLRRLVVPKPREAT